MKATITALALILLAAGCGPAPNSGTLRDAFFGQIATMTGVTSFEVRQNTITFEYRSDDYTCTVIASEIEPLDHENYSHVGSLDCSFTMNGEPLARFDGLQSRDIESDAIVAAWDRQHNRWRFDVEFR